MLKTQMIGNANELKCMLAFIELGYECSIPYGNEAKYDFIADVDGKLLKILCKASRYVKNKGIIDYNVICFDCTSLTVNTKKAKRHIYTKQDIDYFATSFNNIVYIVPVSECGTCKYLRFNKPGNNSNNYTNASDYELTKIFNKNIVDNIPEPLYTEQHLKEKSYCKYCGKEVYSGNNICPSCSSFLKRKVTRPNKEDLLKLINEKSFLEIGRMYNVSDNAIRKWCKSYKIPYRKKDIC